jgi:hypothetical protein
MDTSEKSRFGAPYGPDRYRRLNDHFQACADLPSKERERYLHGPEIADSGLREELRELLRYHAPTPPPAEAPRPRPRRRGWIRRPLLISGIGTATTLLVLAVRTSTVDHLDGALREEAVRRLHDVVDSRSALLRSWARHRLELARSVLEAADFRDQVAALAEAAESSRESPQEALLESPSYQWVSERMSRVPPELGERGFMVLSRTGVILCSESEAQAGRPPGPDGAACRQRMLLGEEVLDGEVAGGAIRDHRGRVQAIALFRSSGDQAVRGLLSSAAPVALSVVHGEGPVSEDSETRLGVWSRVPELDLGLRAEIDLGAVLAPARPLRSGSALLLPLPGLLTLGLLFPALRARFSRRLGKGAALGSYILERPLGQGGMGEVFLAHHAVLGRPAALKILQPGRSSVATALRFEQEARLASRLEHPNLIQVFEFGETPEGRLYYAMEYVKGLTLAQLLALEGRLPVARALALLGQISDGLEEAHRVGLLHRDLKPANVMVCTRGGRADLVKVLDFGISCSVSGDEEATARSTELVGTPAYIAPERIRSNEQRDPRSDVYSFGAVAFHLLTGRNVFEGASPAELIYQALTAGRPSASQIRGSLLPEPLESLIRSCLSLDPESRPADFREVGELLRGVETPDRWDQDDARAWWAQNQERIGMFH